MSDHNLKLAEDRRRDMRLAGAGVGRLDAVVVNKFSQPIEILREPEVVDVSAGGLALAVSNATKVGHAVRLGVMDAKHGVTDSITVETVDCRPWLDGKHLLRCKLVQGKMPASLIYGW